MRVTPLVALRTSTVAAGLCSGMLLVRALDEGFSHAPRPLLTTMNLVLGLLTAAVVMPGPILGFFVTPASSARLRGLAVGGSAVTGLVALVGGTFAWKRVTGDGSGALAVPVLGWSLLALPLAAIDFFRLRGGGAPARGNSDSPR